LRVLTEPRHQGVAAMRAMLTDFTKENLLATSAVVATATNAAAAATSSAAAAATSAASQAAVVTTGISPLVYIVVAIHVLLGIGLIVFVLLHSGKGTGLSSMFGGMSSSATGTSIIEKNLDRITIGLAVGWAITSVLLMMVYRPV
jgi:preprotein translocase subunit SecG